jgi:hypothetical protein
VAAALGLPLATGRSDVSHATFARPDRREVARRAAVGTLFGLHTTRSRIYLQPVTANSRP